MGELIFDCRFAIEHRAAREPIGSANLPRSVSCLAPLLTPPFRPVTGESTLAHFNGFC